MTDLLPNEVYKRIFIRLPEGEKVLQELTALYWDRPSYHKGDTHETAFNEGQRSVMLFLLQKVADIPEDVDNEITIT